MHLHSHKIINMIFETFNAVTNFLFKTVHAVILVSIGGSVIAVLTKPDEKSFNDFLKKNYKKELSGEDSSFIKKAASALLASGAAKITPINYDDYAIFAIASTDFGETKPTFVGAFNNWFYVKDNSD